MACPSEADRQSLQKTRESFENRWANVRHTVSAKRKQAEERLLLCKEFWNEYDKFAGWINETETAMKKSEEAMTSGLENSRSRLKRFEVKVMINWWVMLVAYIPLGQHYHALLCGTLLLGHAT